MAQATTQQMEILVKATDDASKVLKNIGNETENLEKKASGMGQTMNAALTALSVYAGSKGLGMIISEFETANLQISQARFFLEGYGGDVEKNLAQLQGWGDAIQRAGIAGDKYATLVAAKLTPRLKSLSKAQEYGNILLRAERLGIMNAGEAANMMIRATEGNERALRFLVEQMGISAPEFVSLQTLFEELSRRIKEGEKSLSPYSIAMRKLKENFGDFAENAATPLVETLAKILESVNQSIDRYPVLGDTIAMAILTVTTALGGLSAGLALDSLLGLFGKSMTAAGPWGFAIGAAAGFVLWYLTNLGKMSDETKEKWKYALMGMAGIAGIAMLTIGAIFFAPLAILLGGLLVATSMSIEGYQLSWKGFKQYLSDTWTGIKIIFKETWDAIFNWGKDKFAEFAGWIEEKVKGVMESIDRVLRAAANLPGVSSVVSTAKSIGEYISGARAVGGPVGAGQSYLVGERGPEIFTPTAAGMIIPNGGGGSIMIDMRGSTFMDRQAAVQIGDEIIRRLRELHRISAM